jgi:hypothetical protein
LTQDVDSLSEGCPEGTTSCGLVCAAPDDPAYGCGAASCRPCAVSKASRQGCDAGVCVALACQTDHKLCDGKCVSISDPLYGCARSGCEPCEADNALDMTCDTLFRCFLVSCVYPWINCDTDSENGCEANIFTDPNHCGRCNEPCADVVNGAPACVNKNCVAGSCEPPYADCDTLFRTGCETNTLTSNLHCGGCKKACGVGQQCVEGECQ